MRDAFGGVFTMNLLLVFIFIYVAVTAVSLNYAKAFKVKNAIIDFIEQKEISDLDDYFGSGGPLKDKSKLDEILDKLSYNKTCSTTNEITTSEGTGYCYRGVVILKTSEEKIKGTTYEVDASHGTFTTEVYSQIIHYRVITYADWELGAFSKLLALTGNNGDAGLAGTWAINGDAKVIAKIGKS